MHLLRLAKEFSEEANNGLTSQLEEVNETMRRWR
jgi:hypothetical protein